MLTYCARVDIGRTDVDEVDLVALSAYDATAGGTPRGTVEVTLHVPAETVGQATSTALAAVERFTGREPCGVVVRSEQDPGWEPDRLREDTFSVSQAAALLGVTPSAVRQRLAGGTLPGERIGRDWRLPRTHIEVLAGRSTS